MSVCDIHRNIVDVFGNESSYVMEMYGFRCANDSDSDSIIDLYRQFHNSLYQITEPEMPMTAFPQTAHPSKLVSSAVPYAQQYTSQHTEQPLAQQPLQHPAEQYTEQPLQHHTEQSSQQTEELPSIIIEESKKSALDEELSRARKELELQKQYIIDLENALRNSIEDAKPKNPECIVCFNDSPGCIDTVFIPCGHTCCQKCASGLNECPTCRGNISSKQRFYV